MVYTRFHRSHEMAKHAAGAMLTCWCGQTCMHACVWKKAIQIGSGYTGGSDDGDAGGSGWVRGSGGAGGSSGQVSPFQFTGETNFTHATQDQDHGAPTSQRQTRNGRRARSTPKDDDDSNSCSSAFTYPPEPTYPYP